MAQWTMTFDEILSYANVDGATPSIGALLTPEQINLINNCPLYKITGANTWQPMNVEDLADLFSRRYRDREMASETTYGFMCAFQRTWDKLYQSIALQEKSQIDLLKQTTTELLQREKETLSREYSQEASGNNDRLYSDTPNEELPTRDTAGYYTDRTNTDTTTSGSGNENYTRLRSENQAKQYLEITKVFEDLNQRFLNGFEDLFLDFYVLEDLTLRTKRRF